MVKNRRGLGTKLFEFAQDCCQWLQILQLFCQLFYTLCVSNLCVCVCGGGGAGREENTHKLDELDLYVQTQIYINTDSHTHIDQHTPVLCHLDCPPGWTVVVVVCMQNWTPSVTWSLLEGSSTGDVSSTNVIPGREGEEE